MHERLPDDAGSRVGRLECRDGGVLGVIFAASAEEDSCCLQFQGRRAALIGDAERRHGERKKGRDVGSAHGSDCKQAPAVYMDRLSLDPGFRVVPVRLLLEMGASFVGTMAAL